MCIQVLYHFNPYKYDCVGGCGNSIRFVSQCWCSFMYIRYVCAPWNPDDVLMLPAAAIRDTSSDYNEAKNRRRYT